MKYFFVSSRFPYPPLKGDQVVLFNRLKLLSKNNEVTLLVLGDKSSILQENLDVVNNYCNVSFIEASFLERIFSVFAGIFSGIPLQTSLYLTKKRIISIEKVINSGGFDVVNFFLLRTWSSKFRKNNKTLIVVDLIDSMALNFYEIIPTLPLLKKLIYKFEYRRLRGFEKKLSDNVDATFVVSNKDKSWIGSYYTFVLPNGVDTEIFSPKNEKEKDLIIFSGNMGYVPNIEAVKWFIPIYLKIKEYLPSIRFRVIGSNVPVKLLEMFKSNGIEFTGYVHDIAFEISKANLAVAPIFHASGMQNKIIEAWACGVPVLMTSKVADPFKESSPELCFIADNETQFLEAILLFFKQDNESQISTDQLREIAVNNYSWYSTVEKYEKIVNQLISMRL